MHLYVRKRAGEKQSLSVCEHTPQNMCDRDSEAWEQEGVYFCVCVRAHVGAIAASLSIHELRESSKGSWMTHITTGSAQLRWGGLGGISTHEFTYCETNILHCYARGTAFGDSCWRNLNGMQPMRNPDTQSKKADQVKGVSALSVFQSSFV